MVGFFIDNARRIVLPAMLALLTLRSNPADAQLTLQVNAPPAEALVGDLLTLSLTIESTHQLRRVQVSIDGTTKPLSVNSDRSWSAELSLTGQPQGARKQLRIEAEDIYGTTANLTWPVTVDRPPQLQISEPIGWSVARPELTIRVECIDDDPNGCSRLETWAHLGLAQTGESRSFTLAVARSLVEQTVVVPEKLLGDRIEEIRFLATDSAGQEAFVKRKLFVDPSSRLRAIEAGPGRIVDIDTTRVLYADEQSRLWVTQRPNGTALSIPMRLSVASRAFLSPGGAVAVQDVGPPDRTTFDLYQWLDGELLSLAAIRPRDTLAVAGNFAVWSGPFVLRRQLMTGATVEVASVTGEHPSVAANGEVCYAAAVGQHKQIFVYREGRQQQITFEAIDHAGCQTDGRVLIYRKTDADRSVVTLYADGREIHLSEDAATDYRVVNGWAAFVRRDAFHVKQVWLRAPSGSQRQVSFSGRDCTIDSLSDRGAISYIAGDKRFVPNDGAPPIEINTELGQGLWLDQRLHVAIGRVLFVADGISADPGYDGGLPHTDAGSSPVDGGIADSTQSDTGLTDAAVDSPDTLPPRPDAMDEDSRIPSASDAGVPIDAARGTAPDATQAGGAGDATQKKTSGGCALSATTPPCGQLVLIGLFCLRRHRRRGSRTIRKNAANPAGSSGIA